MSQTYVESFSGLSLSGLVLNINNFKRKHGVEILSCSTFLNEKDTHKFQAIVLFEKMEVTVLGVLSEVADS